MTTVINGARRWPRDVFPSRADQYFGPITGYGGSEMVLDQSITRDELGLLRPIQLVVGGEYVNGAALFVSPAVSGDDRRTINRN